MEKTPTIKLINNGAGEVVGVAVEDEYGRLRLIEDQGFLDYICQNDIAGLDQEDLSTLSANVDPTYQSTMTEIPCFPEEVLWDSPLDLEETILGPGPNSWRIPVETPETFPIKAVPEEQEDSAVDHPKHYNSHPSGIECIEVARWYNFNIGNAIKYLWRHGLKTEEGKNNIDKSIEDLEKAKWYINDEIQLLDKQKKTKK